MSYIPDILLEGEWVDVYATTGIANGTPVSIQNKSSAPLVVYVGGAIPTSGTDGVVVFAKQVKYFTCASPDGLYAFGRGLAVVQEGYIDQSGLQLVDASTGLLRPATTADFASSWSTSAYVLDADGELVSETQSNGSQQRTRTWTHTTDGVGNVTSSAGEWVTV